MGTTLMRFIAAASISWRSWREGRRLGGGGRLAEGISGEWVAGRPGDVGGVRLAWAVAGRTESGGGRLSAFASIEELREGPPRVGSTRATLRIGGACGREALARDLEERMDGPRETPGLSLPGPKARVPVDVLDSTELDRERAEGPLALYVSPKSPGCRSSFGFLSCSRSGSRSCTDALE